MGKIAKFVGFNGTLLTGFGAYTFYQHPDLRNNPKQFLWACRRSLRCYTTGVMMLSDYLLCKEITSDVHRTASKRLYECFATNAGAYIKLGQMIHQLNNLIPKEYNETFEPMCQRAPKTKYEEVRRIFKEETGKELEEVFSEFDKEPIASASLAQVHRARLRSTGEEVAVKCQHSWIREQVPGDLRMTRFATDFAKWVFPDYKYEWLADEFEKRLPKELDFTLEAKNAIRCKKMFEGNKQVHVPKVYLEQTHGRILTMEFEKGLNVCNLQELKAQDISFRDLSKLISETFTRMIFQEGFIHADPHPGNMMVRKDANGELQLVILDHGIYADISKESRLAYTKLWRGILSQDELMIRTAAKQLDVDYPELFASMVANRKYEDIMDESHKHNTIKRLAIKTDAAGIEETRKTAMHYHKDICDILDTMKREVLLVFKTNDYLRAIDNRLGYPANSFNIINEMTWRIFQSELTKEDPIANSLYSLERRRYYTFKFKMFVLRLYLQIMTWFGVKPHPDYMREFEFDV